MSILNQSSEKKEKVYTPEEEASRNSEAYYQATQDVERGGMNPNEAFERRGFIKNNRGNWVLKR